jgi:hypothetical protein
MDTNRHLQRLQSNGQAFKWKATYKSRNGSSLFSVGQCHKNRLAQLQRMRRNGRAFNQRPGFQTRRRDSNWNERKCHWHAGAQSGYQCSSGASGRSPGAQVGRTDLAGPQEASTDLFAVDRLEARLPLGEWTGRMTLCGLQAEGSRLSKSPTGNSEEPQKHSPYGGWLHFTYLP